MRHQVRGAVLCGMLLGYGWSAYGDTATKSFTHEGEVGTIIAWIDNKQDPTTPTGLTDWENPNTMSTQSDSVAIFRLVMNADIQLTATVQDIIVHGTATEPLATYYKIVSDGDGVGDFLYVGGGSTAWKTLNSLTPATFLSTGKTLTFEDLDGQVLLTVTVRGLNGEDVGVDSDSTEAPDIGSATNYTASLTLLASAI